MQFKIDENLPVEAARLLKAAGHAASTIHDQEMVGQSDPNVASVCRSEARALVTLDLDFSDIRAYPPDQYHGLIVLRPRRQAKPLVLALLERIVIPLLSRESVDRCLWIVDERGARIREGGSPGAP
jgi:predicted nuclease of predicted toxin-antitoxin system